MHLYNKKIEKHKTICCKASWYRKSRSNFRCEKCDDDVTLEIMLVHNAMTQI